MRKIFITVDTGTVGTKGYHFIIVRDDTTDEDLNELCRKYALNNADMYGIYSFSWDGTYESEEDEQEANNDISGWWVPYDSDKHDGYSMSGVPDFKDMT